MATDARLIKNTTIGDAIIEARLVNLENNVYKVTYYEIVTGTSGTITPPTGATFNSNEFGDSGNSILSKINGSNKPTFQSPFTVGGVVVTANLNTTTGAWTTSGTYVDASVALIYSVNISADDFSNLNNFYIIESEENVTGTLLTGYVSTTGSISASDTILSAIEKLNGNIAAIPPSTLLGVSTASLTTPNSIYNLSAGIPVNFKSSDGNTILYLDETNERVGIGTASPSFPLDVYNSGTGVQVVAQIKSAGGGFKLGSYGGGYGGFWSDGVTPTTSNYALICASGETDINSSSYIYNLISNNVKTVLNSTGYNIGTATPFCQFSVKQAPTASANYGLVSLGSGAFDGSTSGFFTGAAAGTLIAGNLASGSTSDLMNLQVGGVSQFKITSGGSVISNYFTAIGGFYSIAYNESFQRVGLNNGTNYNAQNYIASNAVGVIRLLDNTEGDFNRLIFGGYTGSTNRPAIANSNPNLVVCLGNAAAGAGLGVGMASATGVAASAILEAASTTKGFLPPRGTTTQMNAISSPAEGLCFYDSTVHKLYVYDGTTWQACW